LGIYIYRPHRKDSKIVYRKVKGIKTKSRINQSRIYFEAPSIDITQQLLEKGFLKTYINKKGKKKMVPNAITKWIFLDHRTILLRYNAIIRGLINYFEFVDNFHIFHTIVNYILHHSCAKTISRKFRLKTRAGAFKKFGRYLIDPTTKPKIGLYTKPNFKKNTKTLRGKTEQGRISPFNVTNWRLTTNAGFDQPC